MNFDEYRQIVLKRLDKLSEVFSEDELPLAEWDEQFEFMFEEEEEELENDENG